MFSLPVICDVCGNLILRLILYLIALTNRCAVLVVGLSAAARIVTRSRPGMISNDIVDEITRVEANTAGKDT